MIEIRNCGWLDAVDAPSGKAQPHIGQRRAHQLATKGLGLTIASKMTALHGGTIWAESEGLDKGAAFTIELPVEAGIG